ncbi:MAG: GC-type dockerin domain-anchored protein [Planctomycetota bacterium]
MQWKQAVGALSALGLIAAASYGHGGRRFEIKVHEGQLVAHGYNSLGVDDGGGVERGYYNALHDHWNWNPVPSVQASSADLPGFDVFAGSALEGYDVTLTLVGGTKWVSPPMMPMAGTVPVMEPLDASEEIFVTYGGVTVSTVTPGALDLVSTVPAGGALDLDLAFDIGARPSGVIHALEFELSTDAPGVAASDSVYLLLSPDGATPMQKLHHASLYLESYLGTPIAQCLADVTTDGTGDGVPDGIVTLSDFSYYLSLWSQADAAADITPDGTCDIDTGGGDGVTLSDFSCYLALWAEGCP